MRFVSLLLAGVALQLLGEVSGHGYVQVPKARLYECRPGGNNKGCTLNDYANAQQLGSFPETGPGFGNIASAGMAELRQLDEQSATRWWKNPIKSGRFTFEWVFPANHGTKGFSYFITKNGWNPDASLTVTDSFESKPFCKPAWKDGAAPPHKREGVLKHTCTIPNRSGYHVILAMWYVGNWRGWYNVIDVDFSGRGGGGGGRAVAFPPGLEHYNNRKPSEQNSHAPSYMKGKAKVPAKWSTPGPRGPQSLAGRNPPRPNPNPNPAPQPRPNPNPEPQPNPRPTPTPPASSGGCGSRVVGLWGNCHWRPKCCVSGAKCVKKSDNYSQCIQSNNNPSPKAQAKPKLSNCRSTVRKWGNCHKMKNCCQSGLKCVTHNRWYSQCR